MLVYVVRPEDGGPDRTLHRNMLLPCGYLPNAQPEMQITPPDPPPRVSSRRPRRRKDAPLAINSDAAPALRDNVTESESFVPSVTIENKACPTPAPRNGHVCASDGRSTSEQLNPEAPEFTPEEPITDRVSPEPQ